MPWPFCPSCGTVLDPPESGDILCDHCGLRTSYESFGEVEVVTRSQDRSLPEWVVQLQRKGEKQEMQRATVEEACPKCGYPKMEFYTMQLRSADEGQTVFYECLSKTCKHKYSRGHHHHQSRKRSLHVYTHGEGFLGALGHGDFSARAEALPVEALASRNVRCVSAGWTHSAAVCGDTGELLVWGRPFDLKQPLRINRIQRFVPLVVTAINAFASVREVLTSPVSVPLVYEPSADSTSSTIAAAFRDVRPLAPQQAPQPPTPPTTTTPSPSSSAGIRAESVACSAALTVVLGEDGNVYCMGYNRWGQCGQGPENVFTVFEPLRVGGPALERERVTQLAVGFQQVLVLCESGRVFGWGKGLRGQLGIGGEMTELPQQVELPGRVVELRSGFSHAVAILEGGDVYTWGRMQGTEVKTEGRVPVYHDQLYPRKVDITGGGRAVEAFCSSFNTLLRMEDGRVLMWGREADTRKTVPTPIEVEIPASEPGSFFDGFNDTIIKTTTKSAGSDGDGDDVPALHRVSFTSTGARVTPFTLPGLAEGSRVESVSVGWQHTVALVH
eukprot:g11332.t1